MILDLGIVIIYFAIILIAALSGKKLKNPSKEEYFLSSRNLRWPSIAISTIATNVQGYQFLGMMGSAYLYGLAQANFEINAVQGMWMAAFIFVPLYLKDKVITITQFIQKRLGKTVGLFYSIGSIILFATIGLGAALFWGAYAADLVFNDLMSSITENRILRISILIFALGCISALYTYVGGLSAVVRTDIIQFIILLSGGIIVLSISIQHLGGWRQLYEKTPDLMHLHLPADHPKLPWIGMIGLLFLNINYWCANQAVMQRSLAAKSLKDAQVGLLVGGLMKYFMAAVIIIPGIALAGILADVGTPLTDPDAAYPYVIKNFLPLGARGLILCALFASLMSTVDSTFNSLATLWSVDIYKAYIKKDATDAEMVAAGKKTILVTFITGVSMGFALLYFKLANPQDAFTHTLNEMRYYFNTGFVVLICAAAFLILKNQKHILFGYLSTVPLYAFFKLGFPDMNYLLRAGVVILIGFLILALPAMLNGGLRGSKEIYKSSSKRLTYFGLGMILSLVLLHVVFH